MPGFNQQGPMGQGPMSGRKMGECNPSNHAKTDDKIKNAIISLVAVLIISFAERVWNKIREKRLQRGKQ